MKNEFLIKRLERSLQDDPGNAQAYYELGCLYEQEGEYAHAVRALERCSSLDAAHVSAHFALGIVYTRMRSYDLAIKEWHKIVDEDGDLALDGIDYARHGTLIGVQNEWERYREENPPGVFISFNIAFACLVLGRLDEASLEFERVVSANDRFENAHYYLGLIGQRRGQDAPAAEHFVRELELRPHSPNACYALGTCLQRANRAAQAIAHLQRATALKPRYVKAHFRLGLVYVAQGQCDLAAQSFEKALEFRPDFYEAHYELGRLHEQQYRMENAVIAYQRAIDSDGRRKDAHFQLGILYKSLGKLQPALEQLAATVDLDPLDGEAYYYTGLIHYQRNEFDEAAASYQRALQALPNHSFARYSLGQTYLKLKREPEAIQEFRRALEMNPRDMQTHNALGVALFQSGALEDAVAEFERVLEANPRDAQAHYFYGAALFKMQRVDRAIEEYSRVTMLFPESTYAHFSLGASYSRSGEYEKAVHEYIQGSSMAPTGDQDLALFATLQLLAAIGVEHAQQARRMKDMVTQLESVYINTVKALTNAIDARDAYTRFHSTRVARASRLFATHLGYSEQEVTAIEMGGYMHDVGKIGVPDFVLQKEGKLTDAERVIIEGHPALGAEIIQNIQLPWDITPVVRHHHEKWNGAGYPDGLKGDEIPIAAQIVGIADFFDALATERAYKPAFTPARCIEELTRASGRNFEPGLVHRFVDFVDELILQL